MKRCMIPPMAAGFALSLLTVTWAEDGSDNFAGPRPVLTGLGVRQTVNFETVKPTAEAGEPGHWQVNPASNSWWWSWTLDGGGDRIVQIHTLGSSFDTVLSVYTGAVLTTLTRIEWNNDYGSSRQSLVEFQAIEGAVYHIAVDGCTGSVGNVILRIRDPSEAPANDSFDYPVDLDNATEVTVDGSNANATPQPDEPLHAGLSPQASVWWRWTAPTSCVMEVDTHGSEIPDTVVGVYTGATLSALQEIASNDNRGSDTRARTWFPAVSGVVYRIVVDSPDGTEGGITLSMQSVDRPVITNLSLIDSNSMHVAWGSIPGESYRVGLSTNLQNWSVVTTLVASATATVVELDSSDSATCFSRVERYLEP